MYRKVTLLFLLTLSFQCFGQKKAREYVRQNMISICNISPDSIDFSDLEAVGAAIGDARIVMLGEQSHGDGATMEAKSRLIKYLHEHKGFDVLAFEGDFFGLNAGWGNTEKSSEGIKSFLASNIPPIWSNTTQCSNLLHSYIPDSYRTGSPIEISGFDSQIYWRYSNSHLQDSIHQYLIRKNISNKVFKSNRQEFIANIPKLREYNKGSKEWINNFVLTIDTLLMQLGQDASADFGYLALENAQALARQILVSSDFSKSCLVRDTQMAKNLRWLADVKYTNRKIIVWAANAHIMKNAATSIKGKKIANISWMGTQFTSNGAYERQTYIIGFSSLQGSSINHLNKFATVPKPIKNGFETWIDSDLPFGFIDFKRFRRENPQNRETFIMKGFGHSNATASWTNVFDGIFYVRDMTPTERLK